MSRDANYRAVLGDTSSVVLISPLEMICWSTSAGRDEPAEIKLMVVLVERSPVDDTIMGIASQFIGADGFPVDNSAINCVDGASRLWNVVGGRCHDVYSSKLACAFRRLSVSTAMPPSKPPLH